VSAHNRLFLPEFLFYQPALDRSKKGAKINGKKSRFFMATLAS